MVVVEYMAQRQGFGRSFVQDRGFRSVGDILKGSQTIRDLRQFAKQKSLRDAWEAVVGSDLAQEARAVRYRGGKLHVVVRSPPLLQELATFRKAELIRQLKQNEGFAGLVDVVFRSGLPESDTSPGH